MSNKTNNENMIEQEFVNKLMRFWSIFINTLILILVLMNFQSNLAKLQCSISTKKIGSKRDVGTRDFPTSVHVKNAYVGNIEKLIR